MYGKVSVGHISSSGALLTDRRGDRVPHLIVLIANLERPMETTILNQQTIDQLQRIRRAVHGIEACANVLNTDMTNQGSVSTTGEVFVRVTPDTAHGLIQAIRACSTFVDGVFDNHFIDLGVFYDSDEKPSGCGSNLHLLNEGNRG